MTLRLPPSSNAKVGQRLRAVVDVEQLHFFDPDSELAIR